MLDAEVLLRGSSRPLVIGMGERLGAIGVSTELDLERAAAAASL